MVQGLGLDQFADPSFVATRGQCDDSMNVGFIGSSARGAQGLETGMKELCGIVEQ
jgi:hypothetical protein